ncbi:MULTISPECIES: sel1 repeat family protein [unclassified Pseudomonas]|uniref:SEL1-like repeat protein n=1 Tax=unclassified Pseudomonas TaxID=196821 RepID=UPI002448155E|nr:MULTISPECIES: sel1 repeat family protein [unclassified Pseudomonas]MDH0304285.1 sel1 repeat family protein [Pseudomonas sp. GD04091]MDH1983312.1 sel1 repeat family protein [Pseudomonas sp. GD03689]
MNAKNAPRLLLAGLGLAWAGAACAGQSLEQIRYALYKDPSADVSADLRELAARGDLASKQLLGDVLAGNEGASRQEIIRLYREAFADGKGQIPALASLARLLDRTPRLQRSQEPWVREALTRYPNDRDPRSTSTSLEVFLVYPQLFPGQRAAELLALYEQSCLLNCRPELYRAVVAERQGRRDEAERWYRQAARIDPRGIDRYYRFLGERQDPVFLAFARSLEPEMASLSVEVVQRIGSLIDSIHGITRAELDAEREQRQGIAMGPKVEPSAEQLARDQANAKVRAEGIAEYQRWLDHAVARGYLPALVSKASFMISNPTEHNAEQAQALIEQVRAKDPTRAKALDASFYMVNNWLTLDPEKSQVLIDELIAARFPDAQLLLGDLYSKGGLDQPDQERALAVWQQQAEQGSIAAWYRMATVYLRGRAICHDPVKAYTYARIALDLGDTRARGLLRRLDKTLPKDDIERALAARNELLKEATL